MPLENTETTLPVLIITLQRSTTRAAATAGLETEPLCLEGRAALYVIPFSNSGDLDTFFADLSKILQRNTSLDM